MPTRMKCGFPATPGFHLHRPQTAPFSVSTMCQHHRPEPTPALHALAQPFPCREQAGKKTPANRILAPLRNEKPRRLSTVGLLFCAFVAYSVASFIPPCASD